MLKTFFLCVFLHVVGDYFLQGILASMKQRAWWKENAPNPLYKNDWIMALFTHAFSWTFVVMLPFFKDFGTIYVITFLCNMMMHAYIDSQKANEFKINLITDQLFHLFQIAWTVFMMMWIRVI